MLFKKSISIYLIFYLIFPVFGSEINNDKSEERYNVEPMETISGFLPRQYEPSLENDLMRSLSQKSREANGGYASSLASIDLFFAENNEKMEKEGVTKEKLLTTVIATSFFIDRYEKSMAAPDKYVNRFESTKEYLESNYPEIKETIESYENAYKKIEELSSNPKELLNYYREKNDKETEIALSYLSNRFTKSGETKFTRDDLILIHKKLTNGLSETEAMKYNLQSIESSMVEFMFGENISLDQLDYLKSVTQDIGADVVISSDTGFEGIACAQLYAIKEGMNYNKQNEKSKKFALKSLSNSYSYFNAIGVDLEVNCSDGVPYIERVKHIITNELNYSDSDYCSLFESEEKSYKEEFLGESSSVDKASTMLIKAEGTYRFLTSLEVDLSTSCKNGKTLDDYLSELINHIDSSINEGSSENPSGQYLSAGEEKFSNCSLTMDDIVDPNFACDTSKIISTLHQQLTRSIKDRGGESKKLFMNEIWGDSVWGEYPDLPNKECYFYAVTRYKDNKVMYDLKIRGNGVVYNISTKFEPVHYMKNYLQNLKMKKLNENRN